VVRLAQCVQVTIQHRHGQLVTISPYKSTWLKAVSGAQGSRESICRRYVLPRLREGYPTQSVDFVGWEDFTYVVTREFTTAPRRRRQLVYLVNTHGTPEGDPNCRCDTAFRCPEHDP